MASFSSAWLNNPSWARCRGSCLSHLVSGLIDDMMYLQNLYFMRFHSFFFFKFGWICKLAIECLNVRRMIWWFPEIGVPLAIIHFVIGFSLTKTILFGGYSHGNLLAVPSPAGHSAAPTSAPCACTAEVAENGT